MDWLGDRPGRGLGIFLRGLLKGGISIRPGRNEFFCIPYKIDFCVGAETPLRWSFYVVRYTGTPLRWSFYVVRYTGTSLRWSFHVARYTGTPLRWSFHVVRYTDSGFRVKGPHNG